MEVPVHIHMHPSSLERQNIGLGGTCQHHSVNTFGSVVTKLIFQYITFITPSPIKITRILNSLDVRGIWHEMF